MAAREAGHHPVLVEPAAPGGAQAASFGNGAWLSPHSVIPPAVPGLWRRIPGFLRDPLGPVTIRPARLPAAAPWLLRYLLAGWTEARLRRTAHRLRALLHDAPERHAALAARAGVRHLVRQDGLLHAFPDRAAFAAEALPWQVRADTGVRWEELEGDALRDAEPLLGPRYRFALRLPGGHCRDPGALVAALVRAAAPERVNAPATGFRVEGGRLRAVRTGAGEVPADRAVVAAGIHSAPLARELGDRVPLESERGYHAVLRDPGVEPRLPLMPSDGKMGLTLTEGGLRAAGQVEIAGLDAAPDWRRAEILREWLRRVYPALPAHAEVSVWMGHRPSTPDGLPVIGPSRVTPDVWHCFGHGHVGLASAPASAALVMAGLGGGAAPDGLGAGRFG